MKEQHLRDHPEYQYRPRKPTEKKRRMTKRKVAALAELPQASSAKGANKGQSSADKTNSSMGTSKLMGHSSINHGAPSPQPAIMSAIGHSGRALSGFDTNSNHYDTPLELETTAEGNNVLTLGDVSQHESDFNVLMGKFNVGAAASQTRNIQASYLGPVLFDNFSGNDQSEFGCSPHVEDTFPFPSTQDHFNFETASEVFDDILEKVPDDRMFQDVPMDLMEMSDFEFNRILKELTAENSA